ncbi:MAG TPA: Lrp/AsnC family transcriptional regulator [Acetobacteraceae bacterium]|nr:Lrp/AsnC family transcriptional regulator [Acetobacteraceae bacterium]
MPLDPADQRLIAVLRQDGRISNARLAEAVGLSASACLRRLRHLEQRGVIRGYRAVIDTPEDHRRAVFIAEILLERQTDEYFSRFESEIRRFPDVLECYLMTGDYDYLVRVEAADPADYERIHRDQLARLPGVARIRTSFAIRRVIGASGAAPG